ncbi:hypothetical protein PCANC_28810 [Puccinia coronata f. sp. avenae]|uniref:Uncharacterized protein n=1 Tax=Puccinia coronata f. sp. avenae TaxID=200324 RepID=A0A2N5TIP0_9BASI|nr:hypothetical protein PCANC_28810 [Puccinia coronata f. sp. avenae]
MAAQLEQINLRYCTTLCNSTKTRHQVKQVGQRIDGLEGQMCNVLDAMTALLASVDRLNNRAAETTRQGTPFSTSAKPEGNETPKYFFHMKSFLKDPMQLHRLIQSTVEYLKFSSKNFTLHTL